MTRLFARNVGVVGRNCVSCLHYTLSEINNKVLSITLRVSLFLKLRIVQMKTELFKPFKKRERERVELVYNFELAKIVARKAAQIELDRGGSEGMENRHSFRPCLYFNIHPLLMIFLQD